MGRESGYRFGLPVRNTHMRFGETEGLCMVAGGDAGESGETRFTQQKWRQTRKKAGDSATHHRRPFDLPGGQKILNQVRKVE